MELEEQNQLESEAIQMESLFNSGHYAELETLASSFVEKHPHIGFGWSVLGTALQLQGKDALPALRKTAELLPQDALAHKNLGDALQSLGQHAQAEASYRLSLEIDPNLAETHVNLGNSLKAQSLLANAEACYQQALMLRPEFAEAHYNLGITLKAMGRLHEAEGTLRQAVHMNPHFGQAHVELGNTIRELDRLEDAEAILRTAIELIPTLAEAHANLGAILRSLGHPNQAEDCFRKAIALDPELAEASSNLGAVLLGLSRSSEAEECFRQAVRINPQMAEAHSGLAAALKDLDRPAEALASCRAAIRINPHLAEAFNNLGVLLSELGQSEEAESCYRQAIQIDPMFADAYSNRLFHLSHMESVDAKKLFAEHQVFAAQFEAPLIPSWPHHTNRRDPNRTLRVGFVSADLRTHPVASFFEPVVAGLARSTDLSLYAYYNHSHEDATSLRLRSHMPNWRSIVGLSYEAVASIILEDRIDILVDLSGHTGRHCLLTFARKPAPVQLSWMGYAGTTGLSAMDYYVADRFFLPAGLLDDQFSEKIVRLPASAPFMPFGEAPAVNDLPAIRNGYLTFGSFNLARKLSSSVIALWSQVLCAIPKARMLIGGIQTSAEIDILTNRFALEGVSSDRLTFHQKCGMSEYLRLHHHVDICLDTFPYPGSTTSCHALWMGVPTITLVGQTPASRQGAWLQYHAGLTQFVATDVDEYIAKSVNWSVNLEELAAIRAGSRARFERSAMGRPDIIGAALVQALRHMWQRWCNGLSAESFEVLDNYTVAQSTYN